LIKRFWKKGPKRVGNPLGWGKIFPILGWSGKPGKGGGSLFGPFFFGMGGFFSRGKFPPPGSPNLFLPPFPEGFPKNCLKKGPHLFLEGKFVKMVGVYKV